MYKPELKYSRTGMPILSNNEIDANRFSAAVLMPKSAVKLSLAAKPNNGSEQWILDAMNQISNTFNVSKEAAFYRLKDLGVIENHKDMLFL